MSSQQHAASIVQQYRASPLKKNFDSSDCTEAWQQALNEHRREYPIKQGVGIIRCQPLGRLRQKPRAIPLASSSKKNARPEVSLRTSLSGAPRYASGALLSPGIIHRAPSASPSGHMHWRNDDIAINRRVFALFC